MVDEKVLQKTMQSVISTGKYSMGAKESLDSVKGSKLLVYSSSLPRKREEELLKLCHAASVPSFKYEGNSMALGKLCGKPFRVSVLSIRSPGEASLEPILTLGKR